MNEHIRNLVKQSGLDIYGLGLDREKWEATVGRFAELIVAECVVIADNNEITVDLVDGTVTGKSPGDAIRKHFGVDR